MKYLALAAFVIVAACAEDGQMPPPTATTLPSGEAAIVVPVTMNTEVFDSVQDRIVKAVVGRVCPNGYREISRTPLVATGPRGPSQIINGAFLKGQVPGAVDVTAICL